MTNWDNFTSEFHDKIHNVACHIPAHLLTCCNLSVCTYTSTHVYRGTEQLGVDATTTRGATLLHQM